MVDLQRAGFYQGHGNENPECSPRNAEDAGIDSTLKPIP